MTNLDTTTLKDDNSLVETSINKKSSSLLRVTFASLIGTTLEFYDHFIYGTAAALIFPTVFFTDMSPELALLLSLITYGVAFLARPLGAILFGHYGDRISRKNMLVLALLIMGVATFLIGCLPGYTFAGSLGALGLCFLRLTQGIALGGEWGGAALMVSEFAKDSKYKNLLGSLVQLSAPIGFLMASSIFALLTTMLSEAEMFAWGWRIPFLISAVLVFVGIYIRNGIEESPEFLEKKSEDKTNGVPIITVIRKYWKNLLLGVGTRVGSDIAFYVFALFPLVFLPHIGVDKSVALSASIAAALGQAVGIPIFGYLSDKIGTRYVLAIGAVLNLIWAFAFFELLALQNSLLIILAAFIALFFLAAMWAPLAAHLPNMFPVDVRYTGAGVSFQTAGVLGGAIAPTICVSLLNSTNSSLSVSIYLGFTLFIALICILKTKPNQEF